MEVSPSRTPLYRRVGGGVISAVLLLALVSEVCSQVGRQVAKDVGPRALALIELPAHGKPRLIPIAVMIDGTFYDASVYKAAPVPMALNSATVYEGFRAGVSQGLFTVTAALHGQNAWIAEGKWQAHAEIQAAAAKKHALAAKSAAAAVESDRAPVLHRAATSGSGETSNSGAGSPPSTGPGHPAPAPSAAGAQPAPAPATPAPATPEASNPVANSSEPADPDRPQLRRGAPPPSAPSPVPTGADPNRAAQAAGSTASARDSFLSPPIADSFPAISDASGPEPRPYAYAMKPEEEEKFSRKMLSLAAVGIRARSQGSTGNGVTGSGATGSGATGNGVAGSGAAAKGSGARPAAQKAKALPLTAFRDIRLRAFDLSSSNEPTLILMATAALPPAANQKSLPPDLLITLIAREDIYGELHQALLNITDAAHLDVTPEMELIDAVDADGDGRGELLFRQVSDGSSNFAVYRVIGNQLWPLFRGTSGE